MRSNQQERKAGIMSKDFHDTDQNVWICRVEWAKVHVDPAIGRPHDEKHSTRLAAAEVRYRPYPVLTYRKNGQGEFSLFVPDGNSRTQAELKRGNDNGYAVLIMDTNGRPVTQAEEAMMYADLNIKKNQTVWQVLKAKRTGKDHRTMKILRTVERFGFSHRLNSRIGLAELTSATILLDADKAGLLEQWLTLLSSFKEGNRLSKMVQGEIEFQRGILDLLAKYGTRLKLRRVARGLNQLGASLIKTQADWLCSCSRTNRKHYCEAMIDLLEDHGDLPKSNRVAA